MLRLYSQGILSLGNAIELSENANYFKHNCISSQHLPFACDLLPELLKSESSSVLNSFVLFSHFESRMFWKACWAFPNLCLIVIILKFYHLCVIFLQDMSSHGYPQLPIFCSSKQCLLLYYLSQSVLPLVNE